MPDSTSSTRVFFRLRNDLTKELDAMISELQEETMGEVKDRSKAARYLLAEAIRKRKQTQVPSKIGLQVR